MARDIRAVLIPDFQLWMIEPTVVVQKIVIGEHGTFVIPAYIAEPWIW